jgi:1-acyl-sn-glycerol-3-phosphate acyltransferase
MQNQPESEEIEISIDITPSPQQQVAETVQELEVEIRNHQATAPDAQSVALDLLRLVRENAQRLGTQAAEQVQGMLKGGISSDYLDPDFWRGLGMVLDYQIKEIQALIQRRIKGEYSTDGYGKDDEIIELVRPLAGFLYRTWWRVTTIGLEHVPADGGVLLVANQSGVLPWDSAMIATAILEEHTTPRIARTLHQRWMSAIPVLAPALAALGQVPALPENARRLLQEGEIVSVFPEGPRGAAKLFRDRYKLAGFDAAEFVQAALRANAPIIPLVVIGAEETYPVLANLDRVARLIGLPYLPITPLFPWLGPLGLIPLPSKWTIVFDAPLDTSGLDATAADDPAIVARLAEALRLRVEALLKRGLAERPSAFLG